MVLRVTLSPSQHRDVPEGTNLMDALRAGGHGIDAPYGGRGNHVPYHHGECTVTFTACVLFG